MKQHCVAGRNAIISSAQELSEGDDAFLGHAAQIAYCHHERWDGNGYRADYLATISRWAPG